MVPCPWARDAAAMYRGEDVGVHLTLNSEWEQLPLGSDHALAEPARRRRRLPAHGRRRVGSRRPRRGPQGVPGAGRAGDLLGLRRQRTSTATWARCSCAPRSSTCTSRLAVDFGLPLRMAPAARRAADRLPVPAARRAGGHRVPRPLRVHERRFACADRAGRCFDSAPGRHRDLRAPRGRQRRAARVAPRLGEPRRRPRARHVGPHAAPS